MSRLTFAILCVCASTASTAFAASDPSSIGAAFVPSIVAREVAMTSGTAAASTAQDVALPQLLPAVALRIVTFATAPNRGEDPPAAASKFTAGPDATFWQGWKRKAELGINGTAGNSEAFNIRALIGAKRISETMETAADVGYIYNTSESKKSKSRGEGNLRNDWLFKDSNWGFYGLGKIEYDEFQNWQWRLSGYAGPSYSFIKDETTTLRGRIGAGGSYEFGKKAKEEFIPEIDIGLDFTHKLTERQNIFASVDYYPSLSNFPRYRAIGKAGWELAVDPEVNMYLKVGVSDRYDSDPGIGFKRNDVEYFVTLGWEF